MTYEPRTYGGCPCGEHPARAADAEGTAERVMLTGKLLLPNHDPTARIVGPVGAQPRILQRVQALAQLLGPRVGRLDDERLRLDLTLIDDEGRVAPGDTWSPPASGLRTGGTHAPTPLLNQGRAYRAEARAFGSSPPLLVSLRVGAPQPLLPACLGAIGPPQGYSPSVSTRCRDGRGPARCPCASATPRRDRSHAQQPRRPGSPRPPPGPTGSRVGGRNAT
jgi:hypothetical protein